MYTCFEKYPTSSLELSVVVGTFQLTLAVPRRSSVSATMFSGHWIAGGSVSEETQRKNKLYILEEGENQTRDWTLQMLYLIPAI